MRTLHVRPDAVSVELQRMTVGTFDWAVVRTFWVDADTSPALPAIDRLWRRAHPSLASAPRASLVVVNGTLLAARLVAPAAS